MKRRFDTHFYTSILPPSFNLEFDLSGATSKTIGSADGKETVSADWLTPSEAIAMTLVNTQELETGSSTNKKSIILFPPQ